MIEVIALGNQLLHFRAEAKKLEGCRRYRTPKGRSTSCNMYRYMPVTPSFVRSGPKSGFGHAPGSERPLPIIRFSGDSGIIRVHLCLSIGRLLRALSPCQYHQYLDPSLSETSSKNDGPRKLEQLSKRMIFGWGCHGMPIMVSAYKWPNWWFMGPQLWLLIAEVGRAWTCHASPLLSQPVLGLAARR